METEKLQSAREVVLKIKDTIKSPFIGRSMVSELTGGVIKNDTLASMDSLGKGPDGLFYIGRMACYPTDSFCDWLVNRVSIEPEIKGKINKK